MKRDPALHPLSHDHHQALLAAQRLKHAVNVTRATDAFLSFWRAHGHAHLRIEEEVLLPGWVRHDANADHAMLARVLTEHLMVRGEVRRLKREGPSIEQLHDLGALLESHVHFEERTLFPRIEERLSFEAIGELGADVAAAEASAAGSGRSSSTEAPSQAPERRALRTGG
jgi:hemerythrin-like domain-containing protein